MIPLTALNGLLFITIPCSIIFVFYRRQARLKASPCKLPYPPGPRRYPLVGNLFDLARGNETAIYSRLAHEYGGTT